MSDPAAPAQQPPIEAVREVCARGSGTVCSCTYAAKTSLPPCRTAVAIAVLEARVAGLEAELKSSQDDHHSCKTTCDRLRDVIGRRMMDEARLRARVAKLEAALRDLLSAHHHSNGDEWADAARAALTPEPR